MRCLPEEARREAVRLGIDLSDPDAALARARELGVPESLDPTNVRLPLRPRKREKKMEN